VRRAPEVEPYLRGCAFAPVGEVAYPRADLGPAGQRLPADTLAAAALPVGVRLELIGDARSVELTYETRTDDLGHRGEGAGRCFEAWRGDRRVARVEAKLGPGQATLELGGPGERVRIYLPEGMRPRIDALRALDGSIAPAPRQPRWLCYGDSIAEGWIASAPALAWPSRVGRTQGLDVVNLGYAGSARGEIVSAEQIAELEADVISLAHGTNCWTRTPNSVDAFRSGVHAFVEVVRQGHPRTPIVAVSPILRPDAEQTPNRLGATLRDLRRTFEAVVQERIDAGDARLTLVSGAPLIRVEQLADGVHPGDAGHQTLAAALGPVVRAALAAGA
jgi:lysophospholipase L1-like esterase